MLEKDVEEEEVKTEANMKIYDKHMNDKDKKSIKCVKKLILK